MVNFMYFVYGASCTLAPLPTHLILLSHDTRCSRTYTCGLSSSTSPIFYHFFVLMLMNSNLEVIVYILR
ncbi:hypothetical protein EDD18DRAFT_1191395 [Armillaria luteobubalina]|uniref:Uncharacterized protein n=1 Tax=Armillaria luteobubalina TaxID=153913 RepID=A0AA39PQ23_9AGAR|nr:hypothetical protein EDD18DRAFT_1191395 [Armillaria luteobubalina]